MRTYSARPADIQREWLVVDAAGKTLGRLATQVAAVLKGKHKPMYTPSMDTGDHVIVVNAAKIVLTGRKAQEKKYFHHTMYPGGATWTSIQEVMAKHPERVVSRAIHGMLPHTKLGRAMGKKLKVYAGPDHPHEAQQPVSWTPGRKGTRN
ncbi:MAG TPA: 50S ribosomal protein L13 [Candidatus Udaeobacter sp.]|jgi:large subunit ribosomal protein L13|nr:50S ribosomal protein L13 [Candidatus Udaeobacter sp.]